MGAATAMVWHMHPGQALSPADFGLFVAAGRGTLGNVGQAMAAQ